MGEKRKIEPKMVEFLDKKLINNGLFQMAIDKKDPRTIMRLAAQACVGIREEGGNNRGVMVKLIQETIGTAVNEAWCMAFVQTMIEYAEERTGVQSPLYISEGCDQVWTGTPKIWRVKTMPLAGAVIIWGKYNAKGNYLGGHTGILESTDGKTMFAYEGNTEAGIVGGEVERDGGGVYYTERNFKANGKMKVRGFLIPFPKV